MDLYTQQFIVSTLFKGLTRELCLASARMSVLTQNVKLFGKIGRKNILYGDISMQWPLANVSHCSHCQCYSVIERSIAFSPLEQYSLLLCSESYIRKFYLSNLDKTVYSKTPFVWLYVVPSVLEGQQTTKKAKTPLTSPHHLWRSDLTLNIVCLFFA